MTDEEIAILDNEWLEILSYLYGRISHEQIEVLRAAVEYPAMPENRAQLLNTCGIYPPETVTPLEAKRMMVDEWKKRRAAAPATETTSQVAYQTPAWGRNAQVGQPMRRPPAANRIRRNAMRRTAPEFALLGGVLTRDKITTRRKTDRLRRENPPISPAMMAAAVRNAINGRNFTGAHLMERVLDALGNHIHYDIPTAFDEMHFDDGGQGEWTDRVQKTAPYFTYSRESQAALKAYLRQHGGVEVRELIAQEDARLANQPAPAPEQDDPEEQE